MQDAQDGQPDPGPPGSALRHGSNPHLAVSHAQQMPSPSPQHYAYQLYSQPPSASSSMTPALQHGSARAYNPVPYHSQSQGTKGDSSSSLHPPAKTSSGGKTFTCTGYEGCSMSFSRSEHLARHVRKHTGEKPFTCRCGKKFTRLDNLRQHASTIHADEPEANEELFEKLAANMPRSGRTTRRKASQSKAPANPPSVEYAVPPDAASTSPYQEGIPQHALVSQERFLPPPNPSSGTGNRPLAGPTQSSQLPSAMYSLPQPLPSPSFRFPTSMHSTPADYDNRDPLRYDNRPYANQYYPYPSTAPQPHSSSSHAYEQHHPAHTLSHPSHAKDDGRDGSSFRPGHHSTSSPARIEPPLADSSAPGEHPHLSSSWTTATQPTPSAAHRPILPSLASLIAGTPVTVNGMDPDTALYHHGSRTMSSQHLPQTKLDSTLLAAAEMAMSTSASSAVPSPLASQGSRSSSFSNSSGYASACLTTATSPPPRMSPCTSLQ